MNAEQISEHLKEMERQIIASEDLIGRIIATIHVNRARGTIKCDKEEEFTKVIESWRNQRNQIFKNLQPIEVISPQ